MKAVITYILTTILNNKMKFFEFLRISVSSNSGISSKRLVGSICVLSGILIPLIAMFLDPLGEVHDSILVLVAQLLTAGCGLLGLTLGESLFDKRKLKSSQKSKDQENSENKDTSDK